MVLFYIISADLSTIIYHFLLFILIFAIFIQFYMACLRTRAEPFSLCALNTSLRSRKYCIKD